MSTAAERSYVLIAVPVGTEMRELPELIPQREVDARGRRANSP